MRLNVKFYDQNEKITNFMESDQQIGVGFANTYTQSMATDDYNGLINKPSINTVVLEGAMSAADLGLGSVYYDTTENWNAQPLLLAERAAIYIYSDYEWIEDEAGNRTPVAGIKIGDGSSYLVDTPFVSDKLTYMIVSHIGNMGIHVTEAEKEFWNHKVSAYLDQSNAETLVLSKIYYERNGEIIEG